MDVATCIEGRRSIRVFKPDPIDDSVIDEALVMANHAPSAGNLQARDFIVVKDSHKKRLLMEGAYRQDFIRTAPVVVAFCANLARIKHYGERGRTLYCLQDAAAAIQNFLLFLHSKGIGSVWVGAFDEEKARDILEVPREARVVALVPIGYPAEEGVRRKKLSKDLLVHREKW